jgi:hypothetical protein
MKRQVECIATIGGYWQLATHLFLLCWSAPNNSSFESSYVPAVRHLHCTFPPVVVPLQNFGTTGGRAESQEKASVALRILCKTVFIIIYCSWSITRSPLLLCHTWYMGSQAPIYRTDRARECVQSRALLDGLLDGHFHEKWTYVV